MIAAILHSSPTFEAVDYNERKVAQGTASLQVMENFGHLQEDKDYSPTPIRQFLIDYSHRNERIQKPQLHVSFSCRGDEMNTEELIAFARKWLQEMGYAHPKQPLLIYRHNDTDNNHIHVITSRVNPQGKKIDHNHERVRSKAFVEKTLGVDTRTEMTTAIENALSYKFSTLGQWQAIMEAAGYSTKQEGEVVKIERNGAYQAAFPLKDILEKAASKEEKTNKKRVNQLKAWLLKYRDICASKEELQEIMKKKFGIDLVFFGGKDNPRGYFVVDHPKKQVTKGSAVMKLSALLQFETAEEKMKRVEAFVDAQLESNPRMTPLELGELLKKHYGGWYEKGVVHYKGIEYILPDYMREALKYNFKVERVGHFAFADAQAKEAICAFFKVKSSDISDDKLGRFSQRQQDFLDTLKGISDQDGVPSMAYVLHTKFQNQVYAIDMDNKVIAADNQFSKQKTNVSTEITPSHSKMPTPSLIPSGRVGQNSSSSANREWEVNKNMGYDEIDDARRLKR